MKKIISISLFVVTLSILALGADNQNSDSYFSNAQAQDLPSIEPPPHDRYLGDGWGLGYSWSSQPVLGRTTINVSISTSLSFDGDGSVSISSGVSNSYNWINCCNPSNALSSCNFGGNNTNCIRY